MKMVGGNVAAARIAALKIASAGRKSIKGNPQKCGACGFLVAAQEGVVTREEGGGSLSLGITSTDGLRAQCHCSMLLS